MGAQVRRQRAAPWLAQFLPADPLPDGGALHCIVKHARTVGAILGEPADQDAGLEIGTKVISSIGRSRGRRGWEETCVCCVFSEGWCDWVD